MEQIEFEKIDDIEKLKTILREKDAYTKHLEQLIEVYHNLEEFTRIERIEADKTIEAHKSLEDLSQLELMLKDMILKNILEINKEISTVFDEDILLARIIGSIKPIVRAQRGVLFLYEENILIPKFFKNLSLKEIKSENFKLSNTTIKESLKEGKSRILINQKIMVNDIEENISLICSPLKKDEKLLGLLYLDTLSKTTPFRAMDVDTVDIFSAQAAISIINSQFFYTIRNQNEELKKLINLKEQFITHLSDDLMLPINKLILNVKKLNDNIDPKYESSKNLIDLINVGLSQINNTLSKVIAISALEKEVEDLFRDEISFKELFSEILAHLQEEIEKRNVNVNISVSTKVNTFKGNKYMLRTIFDEIFCNSVVYNKTNGNVKIDCRIDDNRIVTEVVDEGIGISEENLTKIFEQFYRCETSYALNPKGAGLGLFMVKEILNHYRGNLELKSVYGKGSSFTISLPV